MDEPRVDGALPRQFAGPTEPPAECLDDRPDHRSAGAGTRGAGQDEAHDVNPGLALRAAREARGLSIQDLSRTTKIGGAVLTALEESHAEKLPAMIFTRGFLKAYASEVGLDPDETADSYLAQLAEGTQARLKMAGPAERAEAFPHHEDPSRFLVDRQPGGLGWLLTTAALIGLIVYIWSFDWQGSSDAPETEVAQQVAGDATRASATPSTGADAPSAAVAAIETPIGPLQFQLKPQGPCWLAAAADGTPVFARLLQAGEQETIEAQDELILRVGDPGTLTFSINGMEGRSLGRPGEPVNVRITKDNFREFLSS